LSNYRNKKLTQSAKHEACVNCGADDGTIVWAHSNNSRHGKGMGIKAHDLFGAYLCHQCHADYDSAPNAWFWDGTSTRDDAEVDSAKDRWFIDKWEKSMIIACKKGYL
jgi:hypothetical protein